MYINCIPQILEHHKVNMYEKRKREKNMKGHS